MQGNRPSRKAAYLSKDGKATVARLELRPTGLGGE